MGDEPLGELISAATNVGGTARTLTYQYDADGNRTRITHPDTTYFTYDYDGLDRLTAIRENGGLEQVSLVYDPLGRRSQLARRNGRQTYYEYDAASRLSALTNTSFGSASDVRFDYAYNPASQIVSRSSSNEARGEDKASDHAPTWVVLS